MSRSERWATNKEIKKILTENGSGPILHHEGKKYFSHDKEGHQIFWGESGTGKTRRGIDPLVITNFKHKESMVISDPKGEIYANTVGYISDDYDVYKFDFRRLYQSDNITCWNPLTAPYELWKSGIPENVFRAEQMIDDLAHVMYPVAQNTDPFWMTEARNVFEGAVYALFSYAKPEEVNLSSVYYFISKGEDSYGGSTVLKNFIELEEENENVAMQLYSYASCCNETKSGIRSCLLSQLSYATKNKSIRNFLSNDDIHINDLSGDRPVVIYVILPDETPIYEDLAGLLISQIMNHYIFIAENKWNGKLPVRMNFCLDELGNIGKAIPNLDHMLSAGRSRNIRVTIVLQDISQLETVYGKSKAMTIRNNTSIKILFRVSHIETLLEFSRLCGERDTIIGGKMQKEPLIMPSQLAALDLGQALVMINGRTKFITWLPDYTDIFENRGNIETRGLLTNTTHYKNIRIFDIGSYVKDKRKQKLEAYIKVGPNLAPRSITQLILDNCNECDSEEEYIDSADLIKLIDAKIAELEADSKQ